MINFDPITIRNLHTELAMVHEAIAEKQFKEMKKNRSYYDAMICNTPSGKEKQAFQIGDACETNEKASLVKGVKVKIEEAYEETAIGNIL
jgi:hypothetical protein